ncbi:hypothetical protein A2572_04050 [Candidatus Collierbacteria bacterium RIFOXYD1_FULL_40_9]|uniref:5'-3' exonuclease domain-containing protein n=1 Tax=Candidatus Collierbacteria bacterium RIFOXYD1_FULL_40_9 TaxID=1817731 RepID=A0A1F5FWS4_9BACT|nr:MAG: hypothetical protein A2572_04050 [Candidatus Collierbacteria bacterium RIFOXYD1_FULL_40_9]
MKKLVLIDGNSLLYRAFHAYPPFTTPKGELVGAVYGFTTLLLSVIEKLSPTHVVVAWDVKGPTFRKKEFDDYKAHRAPMDESLVSQIDRTKEIVEAFNIPQFGIEGYEADDIIGTLSRVAINDKEEEQIIIVTGDRDALQLIEGKKVVVYLPIQNKYSQSVVFDEDKVMEVYGMSPKQIIDLKGLMGDASDNIPGVKGVGKVTATKLIKEFGSIENIYRQIDDKNIAPRTKKLLEEDKEMAIKSRFLTEIQKEVPMDFDWEKCLMSDYDKNKVIKLFEELNFKSLINKLPEVGNEKEIIDIFI